MKTRISKLFAAFLLAASVVCMAIGFAACGGDKEPPKTPTALTAPSIALAENVISWEDVEHAGGYSVLENNTKVADVEQSPYTITQTVEGTYSYTVIAKGDGENYADSAASNAVTYTVEAGGGVVTPTQLATPTNVHVDTAYTPNYRLVWNTVDNADGYVVKQTYNGTTTTIDDLTSASCSLEIPTSQNYGQYTFTVKAVSNNEAYTDSAESAPYTYNYAAAGATALTAPVVTVEGITLSWDEVDGAVGYNVYATGHVDGGLSSHRNVLEATVQASAAEGGKLTYKMNPKDILKEEVSYSYHVVAVGDGATHIDSPASNETAQSYLYFSVQISFDSDNTIIWDNYPIEIQSDGSILADKFEVYCDGVLEGDTTTTSYTPKATSGHHAYKVIPVKADGNHLPGQPSNIINLNIYDPVALDSDAIEFAAAPNETVAIKLDSSVIARNWYDFEITLKSATLNAGETEINYPKLDIKGYDLIDDGDERFAPVYVFGAEQTEKVYSATIIVMGDTLWIEIKQPFVSPDERPSIDFNASNYVFELKVKTPTSSQEVPDWLPGDEEPIVDGQVTGTLAATLSGDSCNVTSITALGDVTVPVGTTLSGKYTLNIFFDISKSSASPNIAYTFDASEVDTADSCDKLTVGDSYGTPFLTAVLEFTGTETNLYLINLDDQKIVGLTLSLAVYTEEVESDSLGVGEENSVTLTVNGDGTGLFDDPISLAEGVVGKFRVTVTGGIDSLATDGGHIEVYVDSDMWNPLTLNAANNYTGVITIAAMDTTLSYLVTDSGEGYFNHSYENVTFTLTPYLAADSSTVINIESYGSVDIELDSDLAGKQVKITLSGDDLLFVDDGVMLYFIEEWGEPDYFTKSTGVDSATFTVTVTLDDYLCIGADNYPTDINNVTVTIEVVNA